MIVRITENKKRFLNLLLLADEQESMIDRYLERGEMFVLYKKEIPVAACVITDEGDNVCEIKNIAVLPQYQRQGYGRRLIDFLFERYKKSYREILFQPYLFMNIAALCVLIIFQDFLQIIMTIRYLKKGSNW